MSIKINTEYTDSFLKKDIMRVALVAFQLYLLINSQNGHLLIVDSYRKICI